jgi:hypothetical protein
LLVEEVEEGDLLFGRLAIFSLHFDVQAVVDIAGDWQAGVRHAGAKSLSLQKNGLSREARTIGPARVWQFRAVGYGVKEAQFRVAVHVEVDPCKEVGLVLVFVNSWFFWWHWHSFLVGRPGKRAG